MNLRKIFIAVSLVFPLALSAAELPSLPSGGEYVVGVLDNGIRYYLVENGEKKGFADFALVHRGYVDALQARGSLDTCRHFRDRKPFEFLADNGIAYTRSDGYLKYRDASVVYRFNNVPVINTVVRDSTLLLLMDLADKPGNAPAIVIAGDIQTGKVIERLKMLSMLVPARFTEDEYEKYVWNSCPEAVWLERRNGDNAVARLEFVYSNSRTPRKLMNTVQPVLFRMMTEDFGEVLQRRVNRAMYKSNIPVSGLMFRHRDSSRESGDEEFALSFWTVPDSLAASVGIVSSVLSSLDKYGVPREEFSYVHDFNLAAYRKKSYESQTNRAYVDKCLSAYLYNGDLASPQNILNFIESKDIDAGRQTELFNGFVSALLDSAANLSVKYDIPDSFSLGVNLREVFDSCWRVADKGEGIYKDKAPVLPVPGSKLKLVSETKEPISGGVLWTFSNGMKVIYKQSGKTQTFEYALLVRKGFMDIPGINPGENAFVPDLFFRRRVAGVSGRTFGDFLSRNCITMNCSTSVSDFTLSGSAPAVQLNTLLSSLVAVANTGQLDNRGISRYKDRELLRERVFKHSTATVNAKMDSLVRPAYLWNSSKNINNFKEDLPDRAGQYFDRVFSNLSDGVLIICGNLDETVLKNALCRQLGGFRTLKSRSARPLVSSKLINGNVSLVENSISGPGGQMVKGVNVELSAEIPANMKTLICFKLGRLAIERELVKNLADKGAWLQTSDKIEFYPSDRMSIFINCGICKRSGVPASVEPASLVDVLTAVRKTTDRLQNVNVSEFEGLKTMLLGTYKDELEKPSSIIAHLLCRYSEGRDIVTRFESELKSVTPDSVSDILSKLSSGAKVEYVIK